MIYFFLLSLILNILSIFLIAFFRRKNQYYLKDRFTSAYNYFFFDEKFDSYLKAGNHFLFIDIDNFKRQNIQFGYEVADQLLSLFVNRLRELLPPKTIILRYKLGDEFVLILQETNHQLSADVISKLKKHRDHFIFEINGNTICLDFTISDMAFQFGDSKHALLDRLVHNNLNLKKSAK